MTVPLDVRIRPVALSDRDALLRWRNDPTNYAWYRTAVPVDAVSHDRWFSARLGDDPPTLFIAEAGDAPLGSVRADVSAEATASVSIVVDPDSRGAGVGARLLAFIADWAARQGLTMLVAEIHEDNVASTRLFRRAGYRPDGRSTRPFATYRLPVVPG